jgi:hypothetical protein
VLAGPPVDLSEHAGKPMTAELLRTVTDTVMHRVADLLGELRGETPPREFFDMKANPSVKESA